MKKAIAVFDIDGTVLKDNSAERIFVRYLLAKGELGPLDGINFAIRFLSASFGGWVSATKGNKSYLKGKSARRIDELAEACFREEIVPRISDWALRRIEEHRNEDLEIILLSGTLDVLLLRFQRFLHADRAHGSVLSVTDGTYTGDIRGVFPYGRAKAGIVRSSYASDSYDLSASYAYANHYSDLDFLELIGHATLVNPDSRTLGRSKNRGIDIVYY
jgi:HAD superfamily hydrolase (TIGR01490 family)